MKLSYIGHACVLVKSEKNHRGLLFDPWIFGGSWSNTLRLKKEWDPKSKIFQNCDILISHAHSDHLQAKSLRSLCELERRTIFIPKYKHGNYFIERVRNICGDLSDIREIEEFENIEINSCDIKIILNDLGDHDSSFFVDVDDFNIFLQTDNIMSINFAKALKKNQITSKKIDIAFMMFYQTGAYPLFFDIEENIKLERLIKKDLQSIKYTEELATILEPSVVVPYATDIIYDSRITKKNPHIEKISDNWDSEINLDFPSQGTFTKDCIKFCKIKENELQTFKNLDVSYSKKINLSDFIQKLKKYLNNKFIDFEENKDISTLAFKISIENLSIYGCINNKQIKIKEFFKKQELNLEVSIDLNRLSSCFDEYNGWLGLMELWNGGLKCKRYKDIYTNIEKQFWMTLYRFDYDLNYY